MSDGVTESNQLVLQPVGISPFSERERLLCEVMFWVTPGQPHPVGIGVLDDFLETLADRARQLWQSAYCRKSIIEQLQEENQSLRDQIYELEMRH